jgi:tetratricopeptide (TPR) repeat protein
MKKGLLILLCLPVFGFGQTAKDYFDKAKNYSDNEQYQLAIDNYTKCLRIEPDYGPEIE